MFLDNNQQCFAFTPQPNFPTNNLKVKVMGLNPGYLLKSFLLYFAQNNPNKKLYNPLTYVPVHLISTIHRVGVGFCLM